MSAETETDNQIPIVTRQSDGSKIHEIAGHKFKASLLHQPHFCSYCSKFIFGVGKQGYKCLGCETVVHKRCHSNMTARCTFGPSSRAPMPQNSESEEARRRRSASEEPHRFASHFYHRPTFCDHCGSMLYGITKQGVQCTGCRANVHHKCQEKAMHNCGIHVQ